MTSLPTLIKDKIHAQGHMRVSEFMSLTLSHPQHGYYIKQDPLGSKGDFTTAPEISQLFGEMIGIYLYQAYQFAPFSNLIEFGPGKGTLMNDILRTLKKIAPKIYENITCTLIETSPSLTKKQQALLTLHPQINWQTAFDLSALNEDYFVLGNEFFDALPVQQYEKIENEWKERVITLDQNNNFLWAQIECDSEIIPSLYKENNFYEHNPYSEEVVQEIAKRQARALFVDYGYTTEFGLKDTLQALKNHQYKNIFDSLGDQDLTTHVNFLRLHDLCESYGRKTLVTTQSYFLQQMGITERTRQLMLKNPAKAANLEKDLDRLIGDDKMGELFKVLIIE